MRKLLAFLLLAIAVVAVRTPNAYAQQLTQAFVETVAGAPNAVVVGQSYSTSTTTGASTTLTGGTVAAGTYRICVTFFSTSNTETPCSTDTAATSVITTTGSTSTVTVYPPIPTAGVGSITGYRVYVGASAGAAGAETLQTLTSSICVLGPSATASCALTSPAVFTSSANFSGGSGGPATPGTLLTYPTSNAASQALFENSVYFTRIITWTITGTVPSACAFQLKTGAATSSLSNVGQSITCTASGSYAVPIATAAAYSSINLTSFTAGDATTSVAFSIQALPYTLAAYWGPAVPTSACTAQTGLFVVNGTTTSALYYCSAASWAVVTLP